MEEKIFFRKKIVQSLIITAVILLAEIGALFFVIKIVESKTKQVRERQILIASFEQEREGFDELEKNYEFLKQYLPAIDDSLPTEETLFKILEALENAGLKFGIRPSINLESQTSMPSEINEVNYVSFGASFDGNYVLLRDYLKELNNSPIFVTIDSVRIGGNSIFSNGNIQLKGKIYIKQNE